MPLPGRNAHTLNHAKYNGGQLRKDRTFVISQDENTSKKKKVLSTRSSSYVAGMKDSKMSHNQMLKSYYCSEEVKKPDFCKRLNKSSSSVALTKTLGLGRPLGLGRGGSAELEDGADRDIEFLKTLLELNKKGEMLINKRLAKLLADQELPQNQRESSLYSISGKISMENRSYYSESSYNMETRKNLFIGKSDLENILLRNRFANENKVLRFPKYDLNGRRICSERLSEEEEDEYFDCEKTISVVKLNNLNNGSIVSVKKNTEIEKIPRDLHSARKNYENYQKEVGDNKRKMKKSLMSMSENRPKVEQKFTKKRLDQSQGDGVQNVVVHSSKVLMDENLDKKNRKLLKVWNFNDIPKTRPKNCERLSSVKKIGKEDRNIEVKANELEDYFHSVFENKSCKSMHH